MSNTADPNKKRFFPEEEFQEYLKFRLHDCTEILSAFGDMEMPDGTHRPLHCFFSTDDREKPKALVRELGQMEYWVEGKWSLERKMFVIEAWSKKILVSYPTIEDWTKKMVELGFKHDCRFDKWETYFADSSADWELPLGFEG